MLSPGKTLLDRTVVWNVARLRLIDRSPIVASAQLEGHRLPGGGRSRVARFGRKLSATFDRFKPLGDLGRNLQIESLLGRFRCLGMLSAPFELFQGILHACRVFTHHHLLASCMVSFITIEITLKWLLS